MFVRGRGGIGVSAAVETGFLRIDKVVGTRSQRRHVDFPPQFPASSWSHFSVDFHVCEALPIS
ncbi:hypothetical protein CPT76_03600 [Paenibacillus sp. AR247]|nr:hypothetical protein CPT76_03600 [Paenibacillus sp. AR247]